MPIGAHTELQHRAADKLADEGPLTHQELKEKISINDRDEMQAVIRGLSDNGVIETIHLDPNEWKYEIDEDVDPDRIYDK